ncbi:hexitol phosphatase HxpB [Vulgatibacter incomptus]|uniref:2-deoxyglucose-6-phosphate hydrolase YniC n=1 Tax=Vulgatibacter incomptus TaxID=1391653 RepID=A0A0K1PFX3_9BACT|nr:hexitol phosphatase HxpB [Vulgatibacter incomptus]AKU92014.1 2-deoxyglucose-6-phosphate hydrolase YniC [Vulgatibacter incomptus]
MIRAAIFDMDGLLIDSEPFWQEAELEVFGDLGVPITREACVETRGLRLDEVVALWSRRYPWQGPSLAEVHGRILEAMASLIRARGGPMPGALEAIELMRRRFGPVAIATSSPPMLIEAVLEKLGLGGAFDVVHSAQGEPYGKPHPAVFLSAARLLDLPPTDCVALEDSLAGVIAAKSARMACIAVPEEAQRTDPRFSIADRVLPSLVELPRVEWDAIAVARR